MYDERQTRSGSHNGHNGSSETEPLKDSSGAPLTTHDEDLYWARTASVPEMRALFKRCGIDINRALERFNALLDLYEPRRKS